MINLASWTLVEGEGIISINLEEGVSYKQTPFKGVWDGGSTVKQSISASTPIASAGVEHSFETKNPMGTEKVKGNFTTGPVPGFHLQIEDELEIQTNKRDVSMSITGGASAALGVGGEIKYTAKINKRK